LAFFSALRLRPLAKIFFASADDSLPSASKRIGQRLHRGFEVQHVSLGRTGTASGYGARLGKANLHRFRENRVVDVRSGAER
jgi:hypothetical protein